ncbi:glycosyltransferase family 4 protein [Candidatus Solirubrobacter pratensis]|uniref:glycosyltransferase family 4 protein n=1 Tax=Candidatus Solirubrobacter pratensis TaxID=1298857 RepID=UPI00041292BA|nr:glycosyltransferase family 4 protein [Candidatus Solirubrobacter pratensis]
MSRARRIALRAYLTARHPGTAAWLERRLAARMPSSAWAQRRERERRRHDLAVQAREWYRRSARPVLVAVVGPGADARATARAARRTTAAPVTRTVVVPDPAAARTALRPGEDLVLLRAGVRPRAGWLPPLQLAAHQASGSVVGPRLLDADGTLASAGVALTPDGPEHRWAGRPASWPPAAPLQPALALDGACLYVRGDAVAAFAGAFAGTLDDAAEALCAQVWAGGRRVLLAPASSVVARPAPPRAKPTEPRGTQKIVYVTQDTGIGGGHRVIYTHLNGLAARGHDVELWTLAPSGPDWFALDATVRRFSDYPTLAAALAPLDAIKVATWWETAPWVWEASRTAGVAVYWVQDIETSYYPNDVAAHADVLASYRPEFHFFAGCEWIAGQLRELGIRDVTAFTPGLDERAIRPLEGIERRADVVLALGRSNPLKDFPLTLATYQALGDLAPELWLFGIEPQLVDGLGPRARYIERPSDEEVNRLLNEATILLQTSKHEGFCLPVLEAMAAGAAVVCTDAHGNRDFCVHGENCLMPADRSPAALASAIHQLLADPAMRERLSANGRATAAAYAWPAKLDELDRRYREIAG